MAKPRSATTSGTSSSHVTMTTTALATRAGQSR